MMLKKQRQHDFKKILDKLEIIEKAVNKLNTDASAEASRGIRDKPKQMNKTLVKDSEMYKNKRNVYINLILEN